MFMHQFHSKILLAIFTNLFQYTRLVHSYNMRLASKSSILFLKYEVTVANSIFDIKDPKSGTQ